MRRTLNRLAALVCLAGGTFLAATPAPASQASYPRCLDVAGTYCFNPGIRSYCMLGDWQEPIYCSSNHRWSYF